MPHGILFVFINARIQGQTLGLTNTQSGRHTGFNVKHNPNIANNKGNHDGFIRGLFRIHAAFFHENMNLSLLVFTLSYLTLPLSPLRKTFPSQHATLSGFAAVYISVSTS